MANRQLSTGQERLLNSLYQETVVNNKTPGIFRQNYHDDGYQKKWNFDETITLEEKGLIELAKELLLAGIVCPSLTNSGIAYMEALAA